MIKLYFVLIFFYIFVLFSLYMYNSYTDQNLVHEIILNENDTCVFS